MKLNRAQCREIDRRCVEEFHIPSIVLMENAARAVTDVAMNMLGDERRVLILCGGGNNGGDGLAAARHLHNRGCKVTVALTIESSKYKSDAAVNWHIVQAMKLPVVIGNAETILASDATLVIDAIFGTGLDRPPRPPFGELVDAVHRFCRPVLAVDVPSGLDCDTGMPLGACIGATSTITFVAEKVGFDRPNAHAFPGHVRVGDIGCPRELLDDSI